MTKKKPTQTEIYATIEYCEKLIDPISWMSKANELLAAAKLLENEVVEQWKIYESAYKENPPLPVPPHTNFQGVYFMLVAYAIENLCKAYLVSINYENLRNRLLKRIPSYLKIHNLTKLVKDIGLNIDLAEEDLLVRLSRNAIWEARYPIPTDPSAKMAMQQFSDGKSHFVAFFHGADVTRINNLIAKIKAHVNLPESHQQLAESQNI